MTSADPARSRTFVVTGAASGIGLATARRLLAEGGTVVGVDLAVPDDDLGARFDFVAADVTDESAVARHSPRYRVDSTALSMRRVSQVADRSICSTVPNGSA